MKASCRIFAAALSTLVAVPLGGAMAADAAPAAPAPAPSFDEVQATIARMQERLDRLGSTTSERDAALRFLEQQVDQASGQLTGSDKTDESLRGETAVLSNQIEDISRDRDRLTGEVGQRRAALEQLTGEVATLSGELGRTQASNTQLTQELETARHDLTDARAKAGEVEPLRAATADLKREIAHLNELLAAAEIKVDSQSDTITGLDAKLAEALARKTEELEQYRSEFFGRLHKALGDRPDLRVVGDRFVFQSELLFASGSASLGADGEAELRQLARSLEEVAARIPPGVDWILRVDGHTDRQPIRDAAFRSNWELSAARAIAVIEFLTRQGLPPEHLAAAGFGEYRPIDPGNDEIAYRRNRRIEFKLTEG